MEPKKVAIFVVLLVGLVFAGRWACQKWDYYHPEPELGPYTYQEEK
jgi:hypothetical protein